MIKARQTPTQACDLLPPHGEMSEMCHFAALGAGQHTPRLRPPIERDPPPMTTITRNGTNRTARTTRPPRQPQQHRTDLPLSRGDGFDPVLDGHDLRPLRKQPLDEEPVHLGVGVQAGVRQDRETEVQVDSAPQSGATEWTGPPRWSRYRSGRDCRGPLSTRSRSLPEKALPRRLVTTTSPCRGATSPWIPVPGSPSANRPARTMPAITLLREPTSGSPGRNPITT